MYRCPLRCLCVNLSFGSTVDDSCRNFDGSGQGRVTGGRTATWTGDSGGRPRSALLAAPAQNGHGAAKQGDRLPARHPRNVPPMPVKLIPTTPAPATRAGALLATVAVAVLLAAAPASAARESLHLSTPFEVSDSPAGNYLAAIVAGADHDTTGGGHLLARGAAVRSAQTPSCSSAPSSRRWPTATCSTPSRWPTASSPRSRPTASPI